MTTGPIHGWLAEFAGAASLREAVARLRSAGYTQLEAYSPFPVEGLADALRPSRRNPIARLVLLGGLAGGLGMLALQWYASTIAYPVNIGGRPYASWPAFIPAALEMTFLVAAAFGVAGMLFGAGVPRLYHPAFNVARFAAASRDGFFVLVSAHDPRCRDDGQALRELLAALDALDVDEVPA